MNVEAQLVDIPLDVAETWLPDNYRVTGVAKAHVDLQRRGSDWSGTLSWRQDGTAVTVAGIDDETIVEFERNLSKNLYKLWNQVCSWTMRCARILRLLLSQFPSERCPFLLPD